MTDTPNQPASPSNPSAGDPLSSLYRMSKTAGLATSEYQAVNVPSVVALVIGLASFAANFDAVLLIIPLAGLVVGAIALSQIRSSNGTQTGMWMAAVGLLLSLALGAWAGSARYREASRTAADRAALVQIIDQLWQAVEAEKLDQAYGLFSDSFKERVNRAAFDRPWSSFKQYAPLKHIGSNGLFAFQEDQVTQIRAASGQLVLEFNRQGMASDRQQVMFVHRNGRWAIEAIPAYFPLEKSPQSGAGPG